MSKSKSMFGDTPKCSDGTDMHEWVEQWSGTKCSACGAMECF